MNPERWRQIESLYHEACARPAGERAAFLATASAGDAELQREVQALLDTPATADGLFAAPALAMAARMASEPAASLLPDGRLGVYQLREQIGAGGMGEVYRARDTKLGRDVAIKILPRAFTTDPNRLARFEREARMLAALNHPHIGAIYGFEEAPTEGGHRVGGLVLELVEGETLTDRIRRGPMPISDVLAIAVQIADALDAAHEKGIVHRDLKPGNIKITPEGVVKVLDFGLAKAASADGLDLTGSRGITASGTGEGLILGTAAYMSPEQARGKPVDKRTDIWAFGCVLYEMLTGRATFERDTITDTLAAVVEREPDWSALPRAMPASVRHVLRRCLEKDPRQRLRDIGEARFELTAPRETSAAGREPERSVRGTTRARVAKVAAVVGLVAASLALGWFLRPERASDSGATTTRFSVPPPRGGTFIQEPPSLFLALSPDGSQLALVAAVPPMRSRLWLRPISGLDAREVPGTEGARSPFWSPDGRFLAFFADGFLKRVDVLGGPAVQIGAIGESNIQHGTWGSDGTILMAPTTGSAIVSVAAAGGPVETVLEPMRARGETRVQFPHFLPDGRRFLYITRLQDGSGELRLTERGGSPRRVAAMESNVQWVDPDYLLFVRDGVLVGQRFDLSRERLVGEPFPIAEPVDYQWTIGRALFTASRSGTVAYHSHNDVMRLVWSDRTGKELGTLGAPGRIQDPRISPDGRSLLFARGQPGTGTLDLWTMDLARGVETRLTSDRGSEVTGVWLPSGRAIVFGSDRGGFAPHLYRKDLASGVDEELRPGGRQQQAMDVSPSGETLAFIERSPAGNFDAFLLPLANPASSSPLMVSRFVKVDLRFSPDGRAIAYMANDTGLFEVYVAPFGGRDAPITVSGGGGGLPRWSRDGRELFYVTNDFRVMAVPVRTTPSLELGTPLTLFRMDERKGWGDYDVSRDGRFLSVVPQLFGGEQPLTVIVNWIAELQR